MRFEARASTLVGAPMFDGGRFAWSEHPVFMEVHDRARGVGAWAICADLGHADHVARAWAAAQPAPIPNPYEPVWRDPRALTPKQRTKQAAAIRKRFLQEKRARGRHVEQEERIRRLVKQGALFVVSHSGGKDSQAMLIQLRKVVPDDQILVIHAPPAHVEWEGAMEQARDQTPAGRPFLLAHAIDQQGQEKWLLEWILRRGQTQVAAGKYGAWPDKSRRWCTSDWKTGPIQREIRRYADEHGHTTIVEAWGLRAQESETRADKPSLSTLAGQHGKTSRALGTPRRWYVWLPIKWMTTEEVFDAIEKAGQTPLWSYQEGMTRASCAFCVLASAHDLRIAARLAPQLYAAYVAVERVVDELHRDAGLGAHTIKQRKTIEEVTGLDADPCLVAQYVRSIKRRGDLSGLDLPRAVPRPAQVVRLRLPVARATTPRVYGQLELGVSETA